jgi:biopolymer transport protein TolR
MFMVQAETHIDLPSSPTVDLPKVLHSRLVPHARREDAIVVAVTRDGAIFFGNDRIPPDILHERISKAVKSGSEGVIYINADARTRYKKRERGYR